MDGIMDTLEQATKKLHGKRYQSHKFCYDTANNSVIEYDADQEVNWKEYGETEHFTKPRDLTATKQKYLICLFPFLSLIHNSNQVFLFRE